MRLWVKWHATIHSENLVVTLVKNRVNSHFTFEQCVCTACNTSSVSFVLHYFTRFDFLSFPIHTLVGVSVFGDRYHAVNWTQFVVVFWPKQLLCRAAVVCVHSYFCTAREHLINGTWIHTFAHSESYTQKYNSFALLLFLFHSRSRTQQRREWALSTACTHRSNNKIHTETSSASDTHTAVQTERK